MRNIPILDSRYTYDQRDRINQTISCKDCDRIPKVSNAGKVISENGQDFQVMHNGLKVLSGIYGGDGVREIINKLNGHHEPQEELIFHHLLTSCSDDSVIVELGCWWSYYTLWYLKAKPNSKAISIEPELARLKIGIRNSEINQLQDRVNFVQGWCGTSEDGFKTVQRKPKGPKERVPCYDYPSIEKELGAQSVEVLHMDIQGGEVEIIDSLANANKLPRFIVISTHHQYITGNPNTHRICLKKLEKLGARILCQHSIEESYSLDGLIVASFGDKENDPILPEISRNKAGDHQGPMLFKSYSENLEDVMLWKALKDVDKGFYIDIGTAWHDKNSVTKSFYDMQWHGINIEPDSSFLDILETERPRDLNIQKAVSDTSGVSQLYRTKGAGLTTLDAEIAKETITAGYQITDEPVAVQTLSEIWNEHLSKKQDVHFMKIDVGGTESSVIRGNDWKKNRPWVLVINAYQPISQRATHEYWEETLTSANYILAYNDGVNRFYVAEEHNELLHAFKYPPNVFDKFITQAEIIAYKHKKLISEKNTISMTPIPKNKKTQKDVNTKAEIIAYKHKKLISEKNTISMTPIPKNKKTQKDVNTKKEKRKGLKRLFMSIKKRLVRI